MQLLIIGLLLVGLMFLLCTLRETTRICRRTALPQWRFLWAFVALFILGYLGCIGYFLIMPFNSFYLVFALIMFLGGVFACLITGLSRTSLDKISQSAEQAYFHAHHDSLTGLKNRKAFIDDTNKLIDENGAFVLLLIDLNQFKQINDGLGHYFGDKVLSIIADRLSAQLKPGCMLYRMGGDEFTLVWRDELEKTPFSLEQLIDAIHVSLAPSILVEDHSFTIGASIGISCFPHCSQTLEQLLQRADIAMYHSKRQHLPYAIFNEALEQGVKQRLEIAAKIKQALKNDEFELYFQPLVCMKSQTIEGAELLIRWPQPDGTFIGPDIFIPIAEQTDMIGDITTWVLGRCLRDQTWLAERGFKGILHFNLSAKDLHQPKLVEQLSQAIAQYPEMVAQHLILEVTESDMMTDVEQVTLHMNHLAKLGFTFSIDDFGTGYSSLSLLRKLPVSQLKIDRSFVQNMLNNHADRSIVESVIYLAKALGFSVVAEGVETLEASQQLMQLGCDFQQGYYFSPAVPKAAFWDYCQAYKHQVNASSA
ncbi:MULTISPECIES: bifunctional diguanylate cyclase/phosphodiesterase [unclassified Vibrio]|uniref:Bifunctional diguanylate cyclase/phosphodiesterase n=1 Tax=Vibrio sp. HB236076 TaxID=3232307 RepID=A0AB39HIH1_9VIBR|nr:bifunctional diguanylate cyclase/phosphodiesterase [Vibrio sp. HB161653]MDP5254468.1 bifunctional diguanylate cyclase/phosphodiesterase [Vibrio sp. HB161653]